MNRSNATALVLGALIGVVGFMGGRLIPGQWPAAASQAARANTWPPHPRDIVNLQGGVRQVKGGQQGLYTVPLDKYLIVTDLHFSSGDLLVNGKPFAIDSIFLRDFNSPVGLVFPPGAVLSLRATRQPGAVFLTGYLANP